MLKQFGETPLQVSSANGHIATAEVLIKNGAVLDIPTEVSLRTLTL